MRILKHLPLLVLMLSFGTSVSQNLPHRMTEEEKATMPAYLESLRAVSKGVPSPPPTPVRTMAEWEELQGLLVTWTSYPSMLREIVKAAKEEVRVYIVCTNASSVEGYLANYNIDTVNITFMQIGYNSVWSRDYGPWSAYTNEVDTLVTIDWIYNRPRPLDDLIPVHIANQLGTPLYETTVSPYDLVHTGGNFMTDGFGTGFSSNLILNENSSKSEAQIDSIMNLFMGIDTYIKMGTLPYDVIHHIDMHMKLLDEETILMGEYPPGVADGPQIEANLLYVLNNFNSVFGTPYKVVRIPMPPDNGAYPNNNGRYFTYTNSTFINNTVIVPVYNIPQDTTAIRIYEEELPGYTIVGINSLPSISSLGALHCITKELGAADPLLISHQPLSDTYDDANPYTVQAYMKHNSGMAAALLHWRTDTLQPYSQVSMSLGFNPDMWIGDIPAQPAGTTIYYYVEGYAVDGKVQVRPMPAPDGYWKFRILTPTGINEEALTFVRRPFPNPSHGITCIPLRIARPGFMSVQLMDVTGRVIENIHEGMVMPGERNFFTDTSHLATGIYTVKVSHNGRTESARILVN
jgi:agmatine/peptidylarginine deiminase